MISETVRGVDYPVRTGEGAADSGLSRTAILLKQRLPVASIPELYRITSDLAIGVYSENPEAPPVEIYRRLAEEAPYHIGNEVFQKITESLSSIDSNTVKMGKRVLVNLYMKSILSAAENFFTGDQDIDSEIMQNAILYLYENTEKLTDNSASPQSIRISGIIKSVVSKQIAEIEGVQPSWVLDKSFQEIKSRAAYVISSPSSKSLRQHAIEIARESGTNPELILNYLVYLLGLKTAGNDEQDHNQDLESNVIKTATTDTLNQLLDSLPARDRRVLEERSEQKEGKPKTQEKVGKIVNVSRSRIGQLEAKALRKLRQSSMGRNIKDLYLGSEGSGIIGDSNQKTTRDERDRELEKRREENDESLAMLKKLRQDARQRLIEEELGRKPLDIRTWNYILTPKSSTGITLVGLNFNKDLENIYDLRMLISDYLRNVGIERMRIISEEPTNVDFPHIRELVDSRDLPDHRSFYYSGIFTAHNIRQFLEFDLDQEIRNLRDLINLARIQGKAPLVLTDLRVALEILPEEIRSQIQ